MAETTRTTSEAFSQDASAAEPRAAERAINDVKDIGIELLTAVRDSAGTLLDEQRGRAANEITAVADVLRSSLKSLDEAGGPTVAHYAEDAAGRIDKVAAKLRDSSWSELSAEVEDFARRWPLIFIAAAVGLGFAAGRLLVSSPPPPRADQPIESELPPGIARHDQQMPGTAAGYAGPGTAGDA